MLNKKSFVTKNLATSLRELCGSLTRTGLCLALAAAAVGLAQPASAAPIDARAFFDKIVGDWIGICEQSTDGKQADNKYFRATVKQDGADSYVSNFDYYKLDEKKNPVHIGTSSITTTIRPDGGAENVITGKGTMLVDYKPKEQKHNLKETLLATENGLQGKGSGTLSVSGMPLNVGKNGKVKSATSTWTLTNGVLSIRQDIKAGFKAFIFSKNFDVTASYSATRGTDLASLMKMPMQASRPAGSAGKTP